MPETVAEAYSDSYIRLQLFGGRVSLALHEVRRRLKRDLPGFIDYVNTRLELTGEKALTKPKDYYIAPEKLEAKFINCVLVGASVVKAPLAGQTFQNKISLIVYIVNERIENQQQVFQAFDRSDLIGALLLQYINGCTDDQDRDLWTALIPQEQTMLPEDWAQFSGVALHYEIWQDPSLNLWP